ncbi:MAG: hypothetical protein AAF366_10415 [Pseudomonadota bacterium]
MARKALRWAIYLLCVVPALLLANLASDALLGPGPDLDGPTIQDVAPLLIWAAIMLTLWVLLGRFLPDRT